MAGNFYKIATGTSSQCDSYLKILEIIQDMINFENELEFIERTKMITGILLCDRIQFMQAYG